MAKKNSGKPQAMGIVKKKSSGSVKGRAKAHRRVLGFGEDAIAQESLKKSMTSDPVPKKPKPKR